MRFIYDSSCEAYCDRFDEIKKRVDRVRSLENNANFEGNLIDEAEFVCSRALLSIARGIGVECLGEVTKLPNIKDSRIMENVEIVLGPIAPDLLASDDNQFP